MGFLAICSQDYSRDKAFMNNNINFCFGLALACICRRLCVLSLVNHNVKVGLSPFEKVVFTASMNTL